MLGAEMNKTFDNLRLTVFKIKRCLINWARDAHLSSVSQTLLQLNTNVLREAYFSSHFCYFSNWVLKGNYKKPPVTLT